MEDFITIFLMIAFAILGIVIENTKKKQTRKQVRLEQQNLNNYDELLRQLIKSQENETVIETKETEENNTEIIAQEKDQSEANTQKTQETSAYDKKSQQKSDADNNNFDLKSAIIYSTIIERKDF